VIASRYILEAGDIDDPRIITAVETFVHAAYCIDVANWPIPQSEGSGRSGKPGSRGPGREGCPDGVRCIVSLARRADAKWSQIAERKTPSHDVQRVGGVDVTIPDVHAPVRRKDGTFTDAPRGPKLPSLCQEG